MGWSCSSAANEILKLWTAACVEQTGTSNTYKVGETSFFFEVSKKEHNDGAITGTILKMRMDGFCVRNGTFRIGGDGVIERAPGFLKKVAARELRAHLV